jgi:hypothetical protein
MRKSFTFGKVAYDNNKGIKRNLVQVDVELRDKENGPELSICGAIWNCRKTDYLTCGQCLDTIKKYIRDPLFMKLYGWWEKHHLNGMSPACEHQQEAGFAELAGTEVIKYKWNLSGRLTRKRDILKEKIMNAAKKGSAYRPTEDEAALLNMEFEVITYNDKTPPKGYVESHFNHRVTTSLGRLRTNECKGGLLGKKCPVCGWKYGHGWHTHAIPEDVLKELKELLA